MSAAVAKIRSAVTVSLVPEARGGPFVFWNDVESACRHAAELGFDAIEVFAPSPQAIAEHRVVEIARSHKLAIAALGTGAGWVKHRLTLTSPDAGVRQAAVDFIRSIIDAGAPLGASAIIGSMQGRFEGAVSRDQAFAWLAEGLTALGQHARAAGVPLLYEPLNRYETNLLMTVEAGVDFLERQDLANVRLLCDLFHMNIEEVDIAAALTRAGKWLGHVHFVDSNRRAAGAGHMNYAPIAAALAGINYAGYASAEALPLPDSLAAAQQTMRSFKTLFRTAG